MSNEIKTRLAEIKRYFELQDIHLLKSPHAITQEVHKEYLKLRDKYQGEDLKLWLIDQLEQALARNQEMQRIGSQLALYTDRTDLLEKWNEVLQSTHTKGCICRIFTGKCPYCIAKESSAQGKGE